MYMYSNTFKNRNMSNLWRKKDDLYDLFKNCNLLLHQKLIAIAHMYAYLVISSDSLEGSDAKNLTLK